MLSNIASGFWFDIMGVIDLAAGVSLVMGWAMPLLFILVIAKGALSMIMGLVVR